MTPSIHLKFTSRPFDKLPVHCAVITLFSDERPVLGNAALLDWRLNGFLSHLILRKKFQGNPREALLLPSEGRLKAKEVLILGLGQKAFFTETGMATYVHSLLQMVHKMKVADFLISLSDLIQGRFEWRNSVRLLVSKLPDFPGIKNIYFAENEACVHDAKRRHMDFGSHVALSFETLVQTL